MDAGVLYGKHSLTVHSPNPYLIYNSTLNHNSSVRKRFIEALSLEFKVLAEFPSPLTWKAWCHF